MTIPGVAELLALTLAAEIGDIARFPSARKLVGYAGLGPRVKQSGQSSRTGRLSNAGPRHVALGCRRSLPARLAAGQPWNRLYTDIKRRHGTANPAKSAVARKVLIAAWHVLSRSGSRSIPAPRAPLILSRQAPPFVWPPDAPQTI
jgi:transposase